MSGEYLGDFVGDETIPYIFDTFDSNGASVTMTGFAISDINIYKGTSMTQRSSSAGFVLMGTSSPLTGVDIDSLTGIHGFRYFFRGLPSAGGRQPKEQTNI